MPYYKFIPQLHVYVFQMNFKIPLRSVKKKVVIFPLKCLGILLGIPSMHVYTGFDPCVLCILPFYFNLGVCLSLDILFT